MSWQNVHFQRFRQKFSDFLSRSKNSSVLASSSRRHEEERIECSETTRFENGTLFRSGHAQKASDVGVDGERVGVVEWTKAEG